MDEGKEAKTVELDLHCNDIKQQFHAFFDRFANEVRECYLDALMEPVSFEPIILNETDLKIEFRDKFSSKITNDFDEMWQCQDVNDGLTRKFCSQPCTDPAGYRPYNSSVVNMVSANRKKMLKYQIKFYQKHLNILQPKLEIMLKDTEERRRAVEQTQERRQELSYKMELQTKTIFEATNELVDLRVIENRISPINKQF